MGGICCKGIEDEDEDYDTISEQSSTESQTNFRTRFNQSSVSSSTNHETINTTRRNRRASRPGIYTIDSPSNGTRTTPQTNRENSYPSSIASRPQRQRCEKNPNGGNFIKYDPNYFPRAVYSTFHTLSPVYRVFPIQKGEAEYRNIITRITNRHFKVHSIERIVNNALECSYSLRKKQKLKYYPDLEEVELFHGTKWIYADNICKNNFNWRLCGKEVGTIFGKGVCFSCNAMYAANYSDKDEDEKVMIMAQVMIGKSCLGKYGMKLPVEGCDTSTKQNDYIVVVKYDDNEFYPKYRIKYHIAPGYVPYKQRNLGKH